jgi:hypothetical protein
MAFPLVAQILYFGEVYASVSRMIGAYVGKGTHTLYCLGKHTLNRALSGFANLGGFGLGWLVYFDDE